VSLQEFKIPGPAESHLPVVGFGFILPRFRDDSRQNRIRIAHMFGIWLEIVSLV